MKTIEQAAQEYAKSLNLKGHDSFDFETYAKQDFKAGVEFAQRWISVNEELYPSNKQILIKTSNGCIYDAVHNCFDNKVVSWWSNSFEIIKTEITHWRPIELE